MISPQWALISGIVVSFFLTDKPQIKISSKVWSSRLLQLSVVLLGSSLNFHSVLHQGAQGVLITLAGLLIIFTAGYFGIKFLALDQKLGLLITMGTAICGGSAIGALAPVIKAEATIITISMAIVFLLNAVSVFIFPILGHLLALNETDFGTWAALAIHDTSSVVAAGAIYGETALEVATTIKLTRALWIIPVTAIFSFIYRNKENKISIPWFVSGFLFMSLLFTFVEPVREFKNLLASVSRNGFAFTLFLIGLTFDLRKLKEVGVRPLLYGLSLWIMVSSLSLIFIRLR
jgi:uncharacterized integral membrane protein (TIGR00698 family)